MSGEKAGAGSAEKWEIEVSVEAGDSGNADGGQRKRGGSTAGEARGRAASSEEMQAMMNRQAEMIGKKITQVKQGMEDAFRAHIERSVVTPGGALKEMLVSVEQMAKEWKGASASAALAEEGGDAKEATDAKERTRAAALLKVIEEFAGRVRTLHADVEKARNAQRKSVSVAAVTCVLLAAPVLFGIGLVVQQELGVLPEPAVVAEPDPTGGWRSYVWAKYGAGIKQCEREAVERGAPVICELRMTP